MSLINSKGRYYLLSFLKHDLKASITVFFVALPLCLGVALASKTPVYSGIAAGIIGGIIITLISKSSLSVSGPAAGLTTICAAAITKLGAIEIFFLSVAIAGLLQLLLGIFKLGGFTHFIPSAVIKGMLTAIGIILISKQMPLIIGYDKPDFWTNEFYNLITLQHGFKNTAIFDYSTIGTVLIVVCSSAISWLWQKKIAKKITAVPISFIVVFSGILAASAIQYVIPSIQLKPSQYVSIPQNVITTIRLPAFDALFTNAAIWKNAVIICFVATLETLLSIEAIDKLDPYNRLTPQNRELMAQGTGNFISGLVGGLPITAVIVRSAANAEAGARTKLSSLLHGVWLLLAILLAIPLLNKIPFCILAVILIKTGYTLAKPSMIKAVYHQGREQFIPFVVTVAAILFTDLLIGVCIGVAYSVYFLIKHTYRAGFVLKQETNSNVTHYTIELALNVSFLNKKRFIEMLDTIPDNSSVEINGTNSVYIDRDVLEIFQDFKTKAHNKNIQLILHNIPAVETIELH